ncbi:MAG: guanylate kinase [Campylobacteraceae bacterium]|nr:guanylate kinase [Campylobacteraceae bacterium]
MGGSILVISGPSGSGKSSLLHRLLELGDDLYFSISTTTRMARKDEVAGVNYHYITKDMFEKDIKDGAFLEWAKVHDNYYGTSLKPILKALKDKKIVIFDIDVQGHRIVREKFGRLTTSVFITTSDKATLQKRLYARGADEPEVIERRLGNAVTEMTCMHDYDYLLINDDLETTLKDLLCIATLSRHKTSCLDVESFISAWANVE